MVADDFAILHKDFYFHLVSKHIVPIFWTPFQMKQVLANAMPLSNQIYNFHALGRYSKTPA